VTGADGDLYCNVNGTAARALPIIRVADSSPDAANAHRVPLTQSVVDDKGVTWYRPHGATALQRDAMSKLVNRKNSAAETRRLMDIIHNDDFQPAPK
jgi:hypothetical protein